MKPDWIIHYILADRPSSHTHGLDRHGSLELELNLPVPQEKAQMILNLLGLEITVHAQRASGRDRVRGEQRRAPHSAAPAPAPKPPAPAAPAQKAPAQQAGFASAFGSVYGSGNGKSGAGDRKMF